MTKEQIEILRRLIQDEISSAGIDGMEHGAWGWAEKQLDEGWKKFQESFPSIEQKNQANLAIAVTNLLNRIETLEKQLEKQEEYQQEQNETL